MSFSPPPAAYVHVPFCAHRCGYCDFALIPGRADLVDRFLTAMPAALSRIEGKPKIDTLFLGGGTPTYLTPDQLHRLFEALRTAFDWDHEAEVSVEANPAGLMRAHLDVLSDFGVNRISLGVQSFHARELSLLERDHRAAEIDAALELIRNRIPNVSLDLIFGLPGQTTSDWEQNLEAAIERCPQHISAYGLTIEKGTSFWSRFRRGELSKPEDETERKMLQLTMQLLAEAQYQQYEISNYARSGFSCRHNINYWQGGGHWGVGPGAAEFLHSVTSSTRRVNHRSPLTWLKRIETGRDPFSEVVALSPQQTARERLVFGLRMTAGVEMSELPPPDDDIGAAIRRHCDRGWLEVSAGRLRLTTEGRFFADSVAVDLI